MRRTDCIVIGNYWLRLTSSACPEQYSVYRINNCGSESVGYLRLRHGYFYAAVPNYEGERVYSARPQGDGMFQDEERKHYLTEAINAIDSYYTGKL